MSAAIWRDADEFQLRAFIVEQDRRFQRRMRKVYGIRKPREPRPPRPAPLAWKGIADEVCAQRAVNWALVNSPSRDRRAVLARDEIFYRLRTETDMSFPAIGAKIGKRDHASVIVGARRHEKRLAEASK